MRNFTCQQKPSRFGALLLFVCVAMFATSAQAGFWLVEYDLAPGSTVTTNAPGGPFVDPVTGSMRMFYDAASASAPLTGAALMQGRIDNTLSQNAVILTLTGSGMNTLIPGGSGTPGTLSGAVLNLGVVADHTVSGFIHCYDQTGGPAGACGLFFGTPASNSIPQTGSGTFPMPPFNFAATAGVGDFTSDPITITPQSGVTVSTVYVGREVARTFFVPEPTGLAMLVPGALLLAGLARRGMRRH